MAVVSRQDVRRAAVELFATKGFVGTGIRELAAAVGLNSATLYHHVGGGKAELLTGIMRDSLDALLDAGRAAATVASEPERQLASLIGAHVGFGLANPLCALVTDQEMRSLDADSYADLVAVRDAYESLFSSALTRGVRSGVFHLTDVGLARLALLEMCNGVAHWYRPGGRLTARDVQQRFVEFGCRLVGAPPDCWQDLPLREVPALPIEPPGRPGTAQEAATA